MGLGSAQITPDGTVVTYGPVGYGYDGLPLPWVEAPEMDYFRDQAARGRDPERTATGNRRYCAKRTQGPKLE